MRAREIVLPLPPSTNNLYANTGLGRRMTAQARNYKRDIQQQMMFAGWKRSKGDVVYSLSMWYFFPDRRRRDLSNQVKLIEDAIAEYMVYDDHRNVEIHLYRRFDPGKPRVFIRLEEIRNGG